MTGFVSQAAADLALTPAVDDVAGAQSLRALPAVGALTAHAERARLPSAT